MSDKMSENLLILCWCVDFFDFALYEPNSWPNIIIVISNFEEGCPERDELVGVEPSSTSRFPEFEGIIYGMQVEFDTVQYAENVINATMNASPNRHPDVNYLLSIGL